MSVVAADALRHRLPFGGDASVEEEEAGPQLAIAAAAVSFVQPSTNADTFSGDVRMRIRVSVNTASRLCLRTLGHSSHDSCFDIVQEPTQSSSPRVGEWHEVEVALTLEGLDAGRHRVRANLLNRRLPNAHSAEAEFTVLHTLGGLRTVRWKAEGSNLLRVS